MGGYGRTDSLISLLFSFAGRATRAQYLLGHALAGVGAAASVLLAAGILYGVGASPAVLGVAMVVIGACGSWISVALGVKRLHDRGRPGSLLALPPGAALLVLLAQASLRLSGAGVLVLLVPAGGLFLWLAVEMLLLPGNRDDNRYGSNAPVSASTKPCPECGEALPTHASWCPAAACHTASVDQARS